MIGNLGQAISTATGFAGRSDVLTSEGSYYANLALYEVATRVYHKPYEVVALSNLTGGGNERRIAVPTDFDYLLAVKHYSTSTNTLGVNVLDDERDLDVVQPTLLDSFSSTSGIPERVTVF